MSVQPDDVIQETEGSKKLLDIRRNSPFQAKSTLSLGLF